MDAAGLTQCSPFENHRLFREMLLFTPAWNAVIKINSAGLPMNLKVRLTLLITLLLAAVMLIGMVLMIGKAREDVRAEVESTARLAKRMLDVQTLYLALYSTVVWDTSPFRLQDLSNLRHLRVEFFDTAGRLVDSNIPRSGMVAAESPPAWFARVLAVGDTHDTQIRRPIVFHGHPLGELVITPDPAYEIAEIWNDTAGLLGLTLGFFVVLNGMVYWVAWRALKPVEHIRQALSELEQGRMDARLPHFNLPELASIAIQFNEMARKLQQSRMDNLRLTQQLIDLQEQERKSLARNLHDELGQSLTAIQVEASAILGARRLAHTQESANAILQITREVRELVRGMLRSLRPGVLDKFGLRIALLDLVETWNEHNRDVAVATDIDADLAEVPEAMAISAYRIVQECLTNITRHAAAQHVSLIVHKEGDRLMIEIKDDGHGFDPTVRTAGFGLAGMRERVEGLGGELSIVSAPGQGTTVTLVLPCGAGVEP